MEPIPIFLKEALQKVGKWIYRFLWILRGNKIIEKTSRRGSLSTPHWAKGRFKPMPIFIEPIVVVLFVEISNPASHGAVR